MASTTPALADALAQLAKVLVAETAPPAPAPIEPTSERLLLTVEEAAERLGIGRTFAWRLVRNGELRSVRIGRLRRVHVDALRDYTNRLTTKEVA